MPRPRRRKHALLAAVTLLATGCAHAVVRPSAATAADGVRSSAGGEVSSATWVGGAGHDEVFFADCADDGSVTLLGDTLGSFGRDPYELLAVALGPDRRIRWVRTLGRGNKEQLVTARRAPDGGYTLLAQGVDLVFAPFPTMSRPIPLLVKLSMDGAPEWSLLFGRPGNPSVEGLAGLTSMDDGGVVAVGYSARREPRGIDPVVLRVDGRGQPHWSRRLLLGTSGGADAVTSLSDGDLVVAGTQQHPEGTPGPTAGIFAARLAPDGTPRWARRVSSPGLVIVSRSVVPAGDGVVVLGEVGGEGSVDLVAVRLSGDGTLSWARRYRGPAAERIIPRALAVGPAGDLVFGGSTRAKGGPKERAGRPVAGRSGLVFVAGADGVPRLATALAAGGGAEVRWVQPLTDGRICLALTSERPGSSGSAILVATWTPPEARSLVEITSSPLDVRAIGLDLGVEPLPYSHAPADSLEVHTPEPSVGAARGD